MARQHLSACAALYFFAFVLPLAAARWGGRTCHTSFFFPDLNNNDLPALTLLRAEGISDNGASAGLKIFSITSAKLHSHGWIEHQRVAPSLVQVRLLNLHRQTILNPGLSQTLDVPSGWKHAAAMERPFVEQPTDSEMVRTWTVSTNNLHQPISWIDFHPRRGMWHHEFADHMEQKPRPPGRDNEDWVKDLWRMAFGLLFGAATGMVFAASLTLIWSILRRLCVRSQESDDVGFLYGYQELPSPRSAEEEVKGSKKDFTKESVGMVEKL